MTPPRISDLPPLDELRKLVADAEIEPLSPRTAWQRTQARDDLRGHAPALAAAYIQLSDQNARLKKEIEIRKAAMERNPLCSADWLGKQLNEAREKKASWPQGYREAFASSQRERVAEPDYPALCAMLMRTLRDLRDSFLFDDDDGQIGVSQEVDAVLFNNACAALKAAEDAGVKP